MPRKRTRQQAEHARRTTASKEQNHQKRHAMIRGEVIDPADFKSGEATWRIFRIMSEFVDGYQFLSSLSADVTVFGSARIKPGTRYYQEAEKVGRLLAQAGYSVITGGGPGIMEAANKGAYEGGGESIGLNIQLPFEQRINKYVRHGIGFHFFFTRKVMLTSPSQAFVVFPGGFGTVDELFEVLTLIQTHKMPQVPVVLIGKEYWAPLKKFIVKEMLEKHKTIDPADCEIFQIFDSPTEAVEYIRHHVVPDKKGSGMHEA